MTTEVHPPDSGSSVFIDGGTTNTRLWLMVGGESVARHAVGAGVRDVARGNRSGFHDALRTGLDEVVRKGELAGAPPPTRIVAAGMIASELGLGEVPHIQAPAGVTDIAAGVRSVAASEVTELPVFLVPGVRTGGDIDDPRDVGAVDVMRGEETLCLGLMELGMLPPGGALYNLGSHWKVVRTDSDRRIVSSRTSLAGELIHAIQSETILASSVPPDRPSELDEQWLEAGMHEAEVSGLPRALFCVRLLDQRCPGTPEQRLAFLVGAILAAELDPLLQGENLTPRTPVVLAGGGAIPGTVTMILGRHGIAAAVLTQDELEQAMIAGIRAITTFLD